MNGWIVLAIVAGVVALAVLANRLGWIDLSDKTRSGRSSGSVLGIGDEVFAPSRYEAQVELDRQTTLPAPAPIPGDGANRAIEETEDGRYRGQVQIDLPRRTRGRHAGATEGGTAETD